MYSAELAHLKFALDKYISWINYVFKETTMPDDLERKIPLDRSRVNLSQKYEIEYWCKEFGVSEKKLRNLVKQYGTSVAEIRKHL
jgi:hypothetical protein